MTVSTEPTADRTAAGTGAVDLFRSTFGAEPGGLYSAPGRVNLIGEHTDYNQGLVLPFAIDARAQVAARRRDDGVLRVVSAQRPGAVVEAVVSELVPGSVSGWAAYVVGAAWALAQRGRPVGGADIALASTVPVGAGLSSSAAVECASALALSRLYDRQLAPEELARVAQLDENDYVGVPCGLMDQMASSACVAGSVLYFDIGRDETSNIPFDPAAAGLVTLLIDTRAHHSLADGEYGRRRSSCEAAAAQLGLRSLSEIPVDDLDRTLARLSDDELRRRVRHVVTENDRVRTVVELLQDKGNTGNSGITEIGPALTASHRSLRNDFEVSCEELDVAVDAALAAGALGARMTGGGFGGSVISLVPLDLVEAVGAAVSAAFAHKSFTEPVLRQVTPADGARVEQLT